MSPWDREVEHRRVFWYVALVTNRFLRAASTAERRHARSVPPTQKPSAMTEVLPLDLFARTR
jgi:hypothetical protein